MTARRRGKMVWVTRDKNYQAYYCIWDVWRGNAWKPKYAHSKKIWIGGSNLNAFNEENFERTFGIKLKGGAKSIIRGRFWFEQEKQK